MSMMRANKPMVETDTSDDLSVSLLQPRENKINLSDFIHRQAPRGFHSHGWCDFMWSVYVCVNDSCSILSQTKIIYLNLFIVNLQYYLLTYFIIFKYSASVSDLSSFTSLTDSNTNLTSLWVTLIDSLTKLAHKSP